MNRRPQDRLRNANPVSLDEMPAPTSPQGRITFERIVSSPRVELWRPRRRRRFALVLIPIAIGAAVAARYEWFRDPTQPLVVACYQRASLQAEASVVMASARGDVDACDPLWRTSGRFAVASQGVVPPLSACVLATGAVGVFPGQEAWATLGLPGLNKVAGPTPEEDAAIMRVRDAVVGRFLDRCTGAVQAVALIRGELARNGLSTWKVVISPPFTVAMPCASLSADVSNRQVQIVPVRDAATS